MKQIGKTIAAILTAAGICAAMPAYTVACTSMVVSAKASANGRPLLWKHRDTGADNNFLYRVEPTDSTYGFTGLFNGGDSLLTEAWMGVNDCGFAIMNTASYNLAPDTAKVKDREGIVMKKALEVCRTVDDFALLLTALPRPMGVQANFGVIDALGGAAYFETNDVGYTRFDASESDSGVLIRTNFSTTGNVEDGMGYIRYAAAETLAAPFIATGTMAPEIFTEILSRSYYHGLTGHDYMAMDERYVANSDFIPRDISTASIVIEGVEAGGNPEDIRIWAAMGYPPCATVSCNTLTHIAPEAGPDIEGWRSSACAASIEESRKAIPFVGGNGKRYLDLDVLRPVIEQAHRQSMSVYRTNCK